MTKCGGPNGACYMEIYPNGAGNSFLVVYAFSNHHQQSYSKTFFFCNDICKTFYLKFKMKIRANKMISNEKCDMQHKNKLHGQEPSQGCSDNAYGSCGSYGSYEYVAATGSLEWTY